MPQVSVSRSFATAVVVVRRTNHVRFAQLHGGDGRGWHDGDGSTSIPTSNSRRAEVKVP